MIEAATSVILITSRCANERDQGSLCIFLHLRRQAEKCQAEGQIYQLPGHGICQTDPDVPAGTDDFNLKTLRTQTAAALSCFGAEDIVQRSIDYAADLLKRKLVSGVSGVAPVDFFCFLLTLRDFDNELDRCDSVKKTLSAAERTCGIF